MPSQKEPFNEKQLAWCKERLPGFEKAFTDRTRADESAEISNRRARGVYPGEFIGFRNETRTENTAVTVRHGYSTGPSAKLVRATPRVRA